MALETENSIKLDAVMVDELLDALDMAMPDADRQPALATFQDVLQATFQWSNAESNHKMNTLFPTWQQAHLPQAQHPVPYAQHSWHLQQQQALAQVPAAVDCNKVEGTPINGILGGPVSSSAVQAVATGSNITSPFAGIDVASIIQPPAPDTAAGAVSAYGLQTRESDAVSRNDTSPQGQQQRRLEQQLHQHQQRTGRRGRPPKPDGTYSKGYAAIVKYRAKQKDLVRQMEQQVADKLQQIQQLQQQQQHLLSKQRVLEHSMGAQETMLTQLAELKLSVESDHNNNADSAGLTQPQQQQQHRRQRPDVLQRYEQYIKDASSALLTQPPLPGAAEPAVVLPGHHQQQQDNGQSSSSSDDSSRSFPQFPLNIVDTLSLWKVSRVAGVSQTIAAGNIGGSSSSMADAAAAARSAAAAADTDAGLDSMVINLATWLHDAPPSDKWKQIAQHLNVLPQQRQQLHATFQLLSDAIEKLNHDRQALQQQLQQLLQQPAANTIAIPGQTDCTAAMRSSDSLSGCFCSSLSGSDLQGYMDIANAVEWNLVRGRAMVMLFGWSMMCVLNREQVAKLCVAAWPHYPLVRAVVQHVLAEAAEEQTGAATTTAAAAAQQ